MGLFDGILLASDWDSTLFHHGTLNDIDIERIRYFQSEGGRFTLCTGRSLPYISNYFDRIKPNTYVITLNGAIIKHPDAMDELYRGYLDDIAIDVLDLLFSDERLFSALQVYFDGDDAARTMSCAEYLGSRDMFLKNKILKMLLISDSEENVSEAKRILKSRSFPSLLLVSSWPLSLEILAYENGKGRALMRLKEAIGARIAVGIGDFDNDEQMVRMADIGYAVANATASLKKAADRITVGCEAGAVAAVIDELEKEIETSKTRI